MAKGWIPAHRKIYEPGHWLSPSKRDPSCRRDAWLDLVQLATHRRREARWGVLERGEVVVSVRTMGERWGWSKSRVQRFISDLFARTAIEPVRGTPDGTVYRIVNYDTYATGPDRERDTERDTERDRDGTPAGQEQEQKHSTKRDTYVEMATDLWSIWLEELGGRPPQPRLTDARRKKLAALAAEHLQASDDPKADFRALMRAVKASEFHMSRRDYQMPESLFRSAERRDTWVQKARNGTGPASNPLHSKRLGRAC